MRLLPLLALLLATPVAALADGSGIMIQDAHSGKPEADPMPDLPGMHHGTMDAPAN